MKPAGRILVINEACRLTHFTFYARLTSVVAGLHLNCPQETIQSGECLIQDGEDLINLFGWKVQD